MEAAFETSFNLVKISKKKSKDIHPKSSKDILPKWWWFDGDESHGTRQKITWNKAYNQKNNIRPSLPEPEGCKEMIQKDFRHSSFPFREFFFCTSKEANFIGTLYLPSSCGFKKSYKSRRGKKKNNTPWKIDMEVKNGGLEDDVPAQFGDL